MEIKEIRADLFLVDAESEQGKAGSNKLHEMNAKLKSAINNASRDIFEGLIHRR